MEALARWLTRRHLSRLPEGFNPVYGTAVLRLQKKGYSRKEAVQLVEAAGFQRVREPDHFEKRVRKHAQVFEEAKRTGNWELLWNTPSESSIMNKFVRSMPVKKGRWFP